jgi:hypothetical protein
MMRWIYSLLALLIIPLVAFAAAPTGVYASAVGGFWSNFCKYWVNLVGSVDGVILIALVVGAISIFVIVRGKWIK